MSEIANLKHGDKVIINGKKGTVGTVGGCAVEYGDNPIEEIEKDSKIPGNTPFWVNQEATVICGDRGYYEREAARWACAIKLEDGQKVWLEGRLLTVQYKGDYSNMAHFQ